MSTFCTLAANKRRPNKSLSPLIGSIFSSLLGRQHCQVECLNFEAWKWLPETDLIGIQTFPNELTHLNTYRCCVFTKYLAMSVGKTTPVAMFKSWSASSENGFVGYPLFVCAVLIIFTWATHLFKGCGYGSTFVAG